MIPTTEIFNTPNVTVQWFGCNAMSPMNQPTTMTLERTWFEHEHVYLEGNPKSHVHLVLEGVVGIYKSLVDGRRQIVSFGFPGDIVGLGYSDNYSDSAEALNEVRLRSVSVSAIDKLMLTEPEFGRSLIKMASAELARTREQLLSLGRQSAEEKIASFLLMLLRTNSEFGKSNNVIRIPIKRGDIADYLGLTIETISRNFTKMRTSKLIQSLPGNEVRILDLAMLQALSVGERNYQ